MYSKCYNNSDRMYHECFLLYHIPLPLIFTTWMYIYMYVHCDIHNISMFIVSCVWLNMCNCCFWTCYGWCCHGNFRSYRGFLHAHVSYLSDNSPACLMLLSNDREKFFTLQECRQRIVSVSYQLYINACLFSRNFIFMN